MSDGTLAESYDRVYRDEPIRLADVPRRYPRNRSEAVLRLAGSGQRVLEVGCGGGTVLYNLRDRYAEVHGTDLSAARVETLGKALEALGLPIRLAVGNIEQGLDYESGYFDAVIWSDVIEHVIDLWAAMAEVRRLLRPGGRLVTCTPNIAELRRRLTLLAGRFPSTSGASEGLAVREGEAFDGGHLHYFTFSSLRGLYRRFDIEPTVSLGFGRLGRLHNLLPSLLSNGVCLAGERR